MLTYAIKRIGLGLLILVLVMVAMYAAVFWFPAIRQAWRLVRVRRRNSRGC